MASHLESALCELQVTATVNIKKKKNTIIVKVRVIIVVLIITGNKWIFIRAQRTAFLRLATLSFFFCC